MRAAFTGLGSIGRKMVARDAEQPRGVGDRRAVVAGARADDFERAGVRPSAVALELHRQRIDRAADLERSGRQIGFDLEEDVVAGRGERRCPRDSGGPEMAREQRLRITDALRIDRIR